MRTALDKYAVVSGRAARGEFWSFILPFWAVAAAVPILDGFLGTCSVLLLLGMQIPAVTVSVRRLHDLDWSGWWVLLFVVPLGNLALLVLFCLRGTRGRNRFGSDPLSSRWE